MTTDNIAHIQNLKSTLRKEEYALRSEPDEIIEAIKKLGFSLAHSLLEKKRAQEMLPHIAALLQSFHDHSRLEKLEKKIETLHQSGFAPITTIIHYLEVVSTCPTICATPELFLDGCTIVINYLVIKADHDERLTSQLCEGALSSLLTLEQYLTDQREDVARELARGTRYKTLQALLATLRKEISLAGSAISSVIFPATIQKMVESLLRIRNAAASLEKLTLSLSRWKDEMITFSLREISDGVIARYFTL